MAKITEEKLLDLYGETKLKFVYYYKYSFMFAGITDSGEKVTAYVGGNINDIYKFEVNVGEDVKLIELGATTIFIEKDGEKIASWHDW